MNYIYDFSQLPMQPSMSYAGPAKFSVILSSTGGNIYSFKNVDLHFKEMLTNAGVKFYREIDNDNNNEIFQNISFIGTKVI